MDPTIDRWLDAIKVAFVTVGVTAAYAVAAGPVVAAGAAVGGLAAVWAVSPWTRVGRHTPHGVATAEATGPDDVVVYWRPGCTVCLALLSRLTPAERDAATWVNVARDHDAALFVRSRRAGDMVTPTAVAGTGELLDATPEGLRPLLSRTTREA